LNFKVAGIPQINGANPNDKSTYANYWGMWFPENQLKQPINHWKPGDF